jgi:hypothetical protein
MEAAEILRMPYPDLEGHPRKAQLMQRAFTYQWGKNEGEKNRELNPDYHKLLNELGEQIAKVKEKSGKS